MENIYFDLRMSNDITYTSELILDTKEHDLKINRIRVKGLIRANNLCSLTFHKLCAH